MKSQFKSQKLRHIFYHLKDTEFTELKTQTEKSRKLVKEVGRFFFF